MDEDALDFETVQDLITQRSDILSLLDFTVANISQGIYNKLGSPISNLWLAVNYIDL